MRILRPRCDRRHVGRPLAWILVAQALLLGVVWTAAVLEMRASHEGTIEDRALEQNLVVARAFSDALLALGVSDVSYGGPGWARAQGLVERLTVPGDGFVVVLDADGRVVCHPDIRTTPALRDAPIGQHLLIRADDAPVRIAGVNAPNAIAGRVSGMPGGDHLVAMAPLPNLDARLLVFQPIGVLAQGSMVAPTLRAGLLSLVILGASGYAAFHVVRRQRHVLDLINDRLGGEIDDRVGQSLAARHALILGLAKLADCRDADTGDHLERICGYSVVLAEALRRDRSEIDDTWIENLRVAASLHDIGKVGTPDAVLLKDGTLSESEREQIERHPVLGADTLIAIRQRLGEDELIEMSLQICLSHHERWDGTGYPYAVSGEEIPLAARIVAIADVYDALTSPRSYKGAMSHAEACELITRGRSTHFDPCVVDAFLRVADRFDEIRRSHAERAGGVAA